MSPPVLALVPARGGSKSVPRKNVLPIAGKPLIAHSIEQALACDTVTRTIVSTDDDEIREVSLRHGAEVPFRRPAELAQDDSPDLDVFRHALEWLRDREGWMPEVVVHLRPTEPVREVERIDEAVRLLLEHPEADSVRSVSLATESPFKMWRIEDGRLVPVVVLGELAEAHSMPRQRLPLAYRQNGYVDVIRPRAVLEQGSMTGRHVLPFVIGDRVPGLDYADEIPELERAMRRSTDECRRPSWIRHPA